MSAAPFLELLQSGEETGFQTDDVLAAVLPLFRQVAAWHEESLVAPLEGLGNLVVETGALRCSRAPSPAIGNLGRVEELQRPLASALHIIGHARVTSDEETGTEYTNLEVNDGEAPLKHPAYVIGYRTWEERAAHHDAQTDILSLGQLLASLALGLDFTDEQELTRFACHRANLFVLNGRLH